LEGLLLVSLLLLVGCILAQGSLKGGGGGGGRGGRGGKKKEGKKKKGRREGGKSLLQCGGTEKGLKRLVPFLSLLLQRRGKEEENRKIRFFF